MSERLLAGKDVSGYPLLRRVGFLLLFAIGAVMAGAEFRSGELWIGLSLALFAVGMFSGFVVHIFVNPTTVLAYAPISAAVGVMSCLASAALAVGVVVHVVTGDGGVFALVLLGMAAVVWFALGIGGVTTAIRLRRT